MQVMENNVTYSSVILNKLKFGLSNFENHDQNWLKKLK